MLPALLLLPALLQPARLATAHHGCLLKSHNTAADGSFGRYVSSSTEPTADDCALACSLNNECDTFDYNGTQCVLKVAATVEPSTHPSTAGWCPKGKEQQEGGVTPAPAPYKCSATSGEVCRFPFRLDGQVHWDCVERADTVDSIRPVCNVKEDSRGLQSFDSTATFQPCAACAACVETGTDRSGFLLYSTTDNSDYNGLTSSEECQALCQLAPGCNFFTYGKSEKRCWLNYGVGKKVSRSNYFFGPKQCNNTDSNSANTNRAGPTTNNSNNNDNDTNNHAGASRVVGPFLIFLVGLIL